MSAARAARTDSGVVDHQTRRLAEPVFTGISEVTDLLKFGDVAYDVETLAAGLPHHLGRLLRSDGVFVRTHNTSTSASKLNGERAADTAPCACDYCVGAVGSTW